MSRTHLCWPMADNSTLTGGYPDIKDVLGMTDFPEWQVELMRKWDIQYIAYDRRLASWNNMTGYYFDQTPADALPNTALFIWPPTANLISKLRSAACSIAAISSSMM